MANFLARYLPGAPGNGPARGPAWPLEDKAIGIARFLLLDPNGTRVTVMAHLDPAFQPPRVADGRRT